MDSVIDQQLATDVITLLRESGLVKGGARVDLTLLEVPLSVRNGVPASDIVEAIDAANLDTGTQVIRALREHLVAQEEGPISLRLHFGTAMAAIHIQAIANEGHVRPYRYNR